MNTRESNNRSHLKTPGREARGKHDTCSTWLSSTLHATDKLLIGSSFVSKTDVRTSQFVGESSLADECAPAVEAPAPFAVTAGAINSARDSRAHLIREREFLPGLSGVPARDRPFTNPAGSVEQATRDNLAGPTPLLRSSEILGSGAIFSIVIPEAGMCGFAFSISIPDIARTR